MRGIDMYEIELDSGLLELKESVVTAHFHELELAANARHCG